MVATFTPKLGLAKQDRGDTDWLTPLEAGFDNIEARLTPTNAGNPNGFVAGFWIGQACWDTTNKIMYYCTTATGEPATTVWASVKDGLTATDGAVSTQTAVGFLRPDHLRLHPLCAKAWVRFDGNGTIVKARNVGAVLKNATGDYTIFFEPDMLSTDYLVVATARSLGTAAAVVEKAGSTRDGNQVQVLCKNLDAGGNVDAVVSLVAFDLTG